MQLLTCPAIHDIFAANAARHPERPCVVETRGLHTPERVFAYRVVQSAANQLAHFFLAHGCVRGDVIMIYAHRGSAASPFALPSL